ncbi:MAG: TonB-dependent receptor [Bacteroidota bacterium]|nr:TonB-dependent receptor [Bacteroidota bacterium]|tara:strand:+ start:12640 stop:15843 length:3204 start_codon:yes stop_codon:yes gene_type:complete
MKKLCALLLLLPIFIFGQGKQVVGVVNDDSGSPLPGATIQIKGSESLGAISDFDGKFSILLKNDENTIIVSYVGFLTEQVEIGDNLSVVINLEPDVTELEEAIVVGYGTVLKSDLTGAVSSVEVDENLSKQLTSIDQLLQGRASGVQITQNAANPNSGVSVRIRGTNSLRGNNEPLYVIDGIIVSSAAEDVMSVDPAGGQGNTGQDPQSGLNGINPRDIERIEILKDASATAIYGSRGANGVVLITTKSGQEGDKGKINVFSNTSISSITKKYDMLDGFGYADYQNAIRAISGDNPRYAVVGDEIYSYRVTDGDVTDELNTIPLSIYNWQNTVYQTSVSNSAGVSFSDGNEKGNYYLSAGFNDQNGLVKSARLNSFDLRLNMNYNINEKARVEARLSAYVSNSDFSEGGDKIGGDQSFVQQAATYRPIINNNSEQIFDDEEIGVSNPLTFVEDFSDKSVESRIFASLAFKYNFDIPGLQYELRLGGNLRDKSRDRFYGTSTWVGSNTNAELQMMDINALTYQVNNILRFNRNFNRNHRLNATLGVTYDVRDVESSSYAVVDFITPQLGDAQPFLGQTVRSPLYVQAADQQIFSFLGRFNYTHKNKYTLTSSFRYDGVSKFSEGNRYGFFPSFAASWNASRETFIQDLDVFSSLKLRAGWGQIGNHGISPYGTLANYGASDNLYGTPSGGTTVPLILNNIPNPELTWETTEQLNVGIDFGILGGKISGTIDAYDKLTKDLLQRAPIPTSSGYGTLILNRGSMSNKGLEFSLNVEAINAGDFNLSVGGNIAFNKTKIENLGLTPSDVLLPFNNGGNGYSVQSRGLYYGNEVSRGNAVKFPMNIFIEGEESALFYGWKTDGIFQEGDEFYTINGNMAQAGDIKVLDINGDGVVDLNDRTIIGNPNPDYTYGFNVDMNFKRFSLSMLFNGVGGNDIVNANMYRFGWAEGTYRNILADAWNDRWTPENTNAAYPRLMYDSRLYPALMDNTIEDGSYLRLKNVSLGYDLDVDSINFIDSARVSFTGINLFTWTNYSGYDPEITSFLWDGLIQGTDWNNKPNSKTFLIGLNVEL